MYWVGLSVWKRFFRERFFLSLIFFLAITLRIALVMVNREANDNHIEVVIRLLAGLPVDKDSCWECFQPKLYYELLVFLTRYFRLRTVEEITIMGEFINSLFGVATLVFIWQFLKRQHAVYWLKILCFSLFALNPVFIGINAQATNDSLIIFFGVLSFYVLFQFVHRVNVFNAILLLVATSLAVLSKGNGIVVFLCIAGILLSRIVGTGKKCRPFVYALFALVVTVACAVYFFSPYYAAFRKYGDPFVTNVTKPPPAQLVTPTFTKDYRPGIVTIVSGFFTFRLVDLLIHPYLTQGYSGYTLQRTSFWSQLYATSQSLYFPQYPYSWVNQSFFVLSQIRMILVLALLPLLLLIAGTLITFKRIVAHVIVSRESSLFQNKDLQLLLPLIFFLVFLVTYVYQYRDFSFMKAIFLFPAMLSIIGLLLTGMEYPYEKMKNSKFLRIGGFSLICLICLYIVNVVTLIVQLSQRFL